MDPKLLARVTSRRYLARLLSAALILGTMMLLDGWILVRVARRMGVYAALAAEGGIAVLAALIVGSTAYRLIGELRRQASGEGLPPRVYAELLTVVSGGILLLLPGFATDLLGLIIYARPMRHLIAVVVMRRLMPDLMTAWEYVTLEALSRDATGGVDGSAESVAAPDAPESRESH